MRPEASLETPPVPHIGDAADDPAIWVHPLDPARSLVFGTDKHGGLIAYTLEGRVHQIIADGALPNNVDVLYDFEMGGRRVDLVVAGCRSVGTRGVKVWRIDPMIRRLEDVAEGGVISVFGGLEPYGSCVYRSARGGTAYFFVTRKSGRIEQYRLEEADGGKVQATRVRAFAVGSTGEGCTADDELGHLYLAEERVGIWKFDAEPTGSPTGSLIARIGEHGLTADVEGLTLYCARAGRGYLIASSQGNNTFKVYERGGDNRFLLTIEPRAGRIDVPENTDGIAVTSCPTSTQFPRGMFVAHDGGNDDHGGDFQFYRWDQIAGDRLLVDTLWSPRRALAR